MKNIIQVTAHCVSFNFSTTRERYDRILHPSGMVIVRLTIKEGTTQLRTWTLSHYWPDELSDYTEMTSKDFLLSNRYTFNDTSRSELSTITNHMGFIQH